MTDQPDVAALQAEVTKLRDQKQNLEAENTNFKKTYGWIKDPEKVKADLQAFEQMQRENAGGDPKKIQEIVERETAKVRDQFGSKLTESEALIAGQAKELKALRVTNVAMQEAANHFNPDQLPLLKHEIEANTDWVDGKVIVVENGKARMSVKDPRNAMELKEYMEILANKYPSSAKSQATSGGKPSGTTYSSGSTRLSKEQYLSLTEGDRVAYLNSLPEKERKPFFNSIYSN